MSHFIKRSKFFCFSLDINCIFIDRFIFEIEQLWLARLNLSFHSEIIWSAFNYAVPSGNFKNVWLVENKTSWKVPKYGVISGPYFPVFGLNTGKYGPENPPYLDTFYAVREDVMDKMIRGV